MLLRRSNSALDRADRPVTPVADGQRARQPVPPVSASVRRPLRLGIAVVLYLILPATGATQGDAPPLRYEALEPSFQTTVATRDCAFPAGVPIVGPETVDSPHGTGRACVTKTDGSVVPYEQAEAHISVTTELGQPVFLLVRDFRLLRVQWINERLLYLDRNMGRVAGIDEIFDVLERRWLFQAWVQYF
jgi:hypothetical protein